MTQSKNLKMVDGVFDQANRESWRDLSNLRIELRALMIRCNRLNLDEVIHRMSSKSFEWDILAKVINRIDFNSKSLLLNVEEFCVNIE